MRKFWKEILRILQIYRPFWRPIIVIMIFLTISGVLDLATPYLLGEVIDLVIKKSPIEMVFVMALIGLAVRLFQLGISYWKDQYEIKYLDFDVSMFVEKKTLEKILALSIGQHRNQNTGITSSIISRGQHSLQSFAFTLLYLILPIFFQIVVTCVALLYLSWTCGLIVIGAILLFIALTVHINNTFRKRLKKVQRMGRENNKEYNEIIDNLSLVLINAQEKRMVSEYGEKLSESATFGKETGLKYSFWHYLRPSILSITRTLVLLLGAYYVYQGQHAAGFLVVLMMWTGNALSGLGSISSLHKQCFSDIIAIRKYFSLLDIVPAVKVLPNPVHPEFFKGRIEFRNVSFTYPTENYFSDPDDEEEDEDEKDSRKKKRGKALSNVSFTIESGQKVAFVGLSGAGKSTILNLLVRGYDPDEGQVIIDDNDLRVLDLDSYRSAIGFVEQSVSLFDNTLRYNLLFGLNGKAKSVTDEHLKELASLSCLDTFSENLSEGFDTKIGQNGSWLSGGERQRIGIGRALAKTPAVLIFDEATSSLDAVNEAKIKESIKNASEGRTTILIAHRLSTVIHADKIFVIKDGKIIQEGTHTELMKDCEPYKELVKPQLFAEF